MSITDELRKYAKGYEPYVNHRLLEIADRIDERHERAMADAELRISPTEAQMREMGLVKLPVDADGVPIHVGDEMTNGIDLPARVRALVLGSDGWTAMPTCAIEGRRVEPSALRHVKPDSWERIIRDAQEYVTEDAPLHSVSELVGRCRRLAGE